MNNKHLLPINELNALVSTNDGADLIAKSFVYNSKGNPFLSWKNVNCESKSISNKLRERKNRSLSGLLVGVKDIIATREFETLMGAEDIWPTSNLDFDARLISKLKSSGAVIAGKTVTSEFAIHNETDVINPTYPGFTCGTSSSGSAAVIAAGQVSISIATQTAGSIARPASYCDVIGFKPTFGYIPRTGILKTTDEFDTVGIIGKRLDDIQLVFNEIKISGIDHPLHSKDFNQNLDSVILLTGENYDNSTSELQEQIKEIANKIAHSLKVPVLSKNLNEEIEAVRKSHTTIYKRDLRYYFQEELNNNKISMTLKSFLEGAEKISNEEYLHALSHIRFWRKKFNSSFQNTLILSLAANSGAPISDSYNNVDCNSVITASHRPQISIPLLEDRFGKSVNISLSTPKHRDNSLFSLSAHLLSYLDSDQKKTAINEL